MTTDSFLAICKGAKLGYDDVENMTIGFCLDYIDEYVELNKPEKEQRARTARQSDFDSF